MKFVLLLGLLAIAGVALAIPGVRSMAARVLRHSAQRSPAMLSDLERSRWRQLAIVFWFASITCLAEMAYLTYTKEITKYRVLSFDYLWRVPAGYLLIFAPIAFLALRPSRRSLSAVVFLSSLVSILALLPTLTDGLHYWAAVALASGIARQVVRASRSHAWSVTRIATTCMPIGTIVVGLAAVSACWPIVAERRSLAEQAPAPAGPNIVLVVLDTVRAKSLSLYGYERSTSPSLDRFATKGLIFDRAYATSSWTLPSHGSMFTGRLPHELSAAINSPLEDKHLPVAEVLQKQGYLTAGFVANMWFGSSAYGMARGFQHYESTEVSAFTVVDATSFGHRLIKETGIKERFARHDNLGRKSAKDITDAFLEWAAGAESGRPFFAFLNYFDAHAPYLPPDPYATKFSVHRPFGDLAARRLDAWGPDDVRGFQDAYDGAIAYLDSQLDALFVAIDSSPRLRNTIVIVTSDHGEQFGEHRLLDHVNSLYLSLLHVPLVIVGPGVAPGSRIAEPVSLRDVAATILTAAGIDPSGTTPGRSLLTHRADAIPADAPFLLSEAEKTVRSDLPDWYPTQRGKLKALISRDWQYIRNFGDGSEELFDLRSDPFGLTDRAVQEPVRLNEYRLRLEALVRPSAPPR